MEFRNVMLVHFLAISLAIHMGVLYRHHYSGKHCGPQECIRVNNASQITTGNTTYIDQTSLGETSDAITSYSKKSLHEVIHLDYGDPTIYEKYWQQNGEKATLVIPGWKGMSYFSDARDLHWFLEAEFANAVVRLHKLVGNAVTKDRHIVVGTGSTQLFQAALYAVSTPNGSEPINVVSAAPFYSGYPLLVDLLKSGLYKWGGDAHKYKSDKPYVEVITSPNNPDGHIREAVVVSQSTQGTLVHDLAYYWPQYTPISSPADHDIMLFTVSKCTGHAGTRLGWAIVKDQEIARRMNLFIQVSSIGVSKESQLRAAKILNAVADSHEQRDMFKETGPFFEYSYHLMATRWKILRDTIEKSKMFKLPDYSPGDCAFSDRTFAPQPAFAWLMCEGNEVDDCEKFLREMKKIMTRGGNNFGANTKYTRVCVIPRDEEFEQLVERLASFG